MLFAALKGVARGEYSVLPNPFHFPDTQTDNIYLDVYTFSLDDCETHASVVETDGDSSVFMGGFTQSKILVSKGLGKDPPYEGCYDGEPYFCNSAEITDKNLKGVAYILRAESPMESPVSGFNEAILW